jgi:putative hemolysin
MIAPQFAPDSMPASKVLDLFRESAQHIAIVIDEYGGMEGLVTIQDILEEIVGDVEETEPHITQRDDGSWLIDGLISVDDFKAQFGVEELPGEHDRFATLGGFVMAEIGEIPQTGDSFDWQTLHFEVVDMDGNRVDKVQVTQNEPESSSDSGEEAASESTVEVNDTTPSADAPEGEP